MTAGVNSKNGLAFPMNGLRANRTVKARATAAAAVTY
jgi:hypothetical protein